MMMRKRPNRRLVNPQDWKNMSGENNVTRKINSFLTCHFISNSEMPPDECLKEAQVCIQECERYPTEAIDRIEEYLREQFHSSSSLIQRDCFIEAKEVIKIIKEGV